MRLLLSEPFARFLVLGALIFSVYSVADGAPEAASDELVIDAAF